MESKYYKIRITIPQFGLDRASIKDLVGKYFYVERVVHGRWYGYYKTPGTEGIYFREDEFEIESTITASCDDINRAIHLMEETDSSQSDQWDEETRGPKMSGNDGYRIWKYQMPVKEQFEMRLPNGAQIIRMAAENGYLWLWAVVDTSAPDETRKFHAFKAGGTMPSDISNLEYIGMAPIYIQAELMLYFFEEK